MNITALNDHVLKFNKFLNANPICNKNNKATMVKSLKRQTPAVSSTNSTKSKFQRLNNNKKIKPKMINDTLEMDDENELARLREFLYKLIKKDEKSDIDIDVINVDDDSDNDEDNDSIVSLCIDNKSNKKYPSSSNDTLMKKVELLINNKDDQIKILKEKVKSTNKDDGDDILITEEEGKEVVWECSTDNGWISYEHDVSSVLEQLYLKNETFKVDQQAQHADFVETLRKKNQKRRKSSSAATAIRVSEVPILTHNFTMFNGKVPYVINIETMKQIRQDHLKTERAIRRVSYPVTSSNNNASSSNNMNLLVSAVANPLLHHHAPLLHYNTGHSNAILEDRINSIKVREICRTALSSTVTRENHEFNYACGHYYRLLLGVGASGTVNTLNNVITNGSSNQHGYMNRMVQRVWVIEYNQPQQPSMAVSNIKSSSSSSSSSSIGYSINVCNHNTGVSSNGGGVVYNFLQTRDRFAQQNKSTKEEWVFHGTVDSVVTSIIQQGFKIGGVEDGIPRRHGNSYGDGIYTASGPNTAIPHSQGGPLILARGITGCRKMIQQPDHEADTWTPTNDTLVFKQGSQLLPQYVLFFS